MTKKIKGPLEKETKVVFYYVGLRFTLKLVIVVRNQLLRVQTSKGLFIGGDAASQRSL